VLSVVGSLVYNGTSYTSTVTNTGGYNYSLINYLDIPLVSKATDTKNLYWSVNYYDGSTTSSYTTTPTTQSVKAITLNYCNSSLNGVYMNFTAVNESDPTQAVRPFKIVGTFNYWLGTKNSYKNLSITNTTSNNTALCFSANEKPLYLDANIEYGDGDVQYITKDFK
jgi:hypothetical protein